MSSRWDSIFRYKSRSNTKADKKVVITTDMYSKQTDTHQYLSFNSCHPKTQTKNISTGVANRIRRSCFDDIVSDIIYRKRLI